MDEKQVAKQIYDTFQTQLRSEFGSLWDANKDALQSWCSLLARLHLQALIKKTDNLDLAIRYAEAGLECFKMRIRADLEASAFRVIVSTLTVALQVAVVIAKAALVTAL